VSVDGLTFTCVGEQELALRGGDHLFALTQPSLPTHATAPSEPTPHVPSQKVEFLKVVVVENYGGSGTYLAKVFAYPAPN